MPINDLSQICQVSVCTIWEALTLLKQEDYFECRLRRQAVILPRLPQAEKTVIHTTLMQRSCVHDAYQTIGRLLPTFLCKVRSRGRMQILIDSAGWTTKWSNLKTIIPESSQPSCSTGYWTIPAIRCLTICSKIGNRHTCCRGFRKSTFFWSSAPSLPGRQCILRVPNQFWARYNGVRAGPI